MSRRKIEWLRIQQCPRLYKSIRHSRILQKQNPLLFRDRYQSHQRYRVRTFEHRDETDAMQDECQSGMEGMYQTVG